MVRASSSKLIEVFHFTFAFGDPAQDIVHFAGAFTAGNAFTAGLFLGEGKEEFGHIHHAASLHP